MASKTYTYKTVTGEMVTASRKKQGRKPSSDPMLPITVRLPKSWIDEMDDPRHIIRVALYNYRTRNLSSNSWADLSNRKVNMPEKEFRKWYSEWHKENGAKLLSDKGLSDYMLDAWLACEAAQQSVQRTGCAVCGRIMGDHPYSELQHLYVEPASR